jgi:triosephosphate isomerase
MRRPLIAGNWKMNTSFAEAETLVKALKLALERVRAVDIVVCPPFVWLENLKSILKSSVIRQGAQNLHWEEKGAFTGEISPLMLEGLCDYVILGHSERRQYFKESSELISKKVAAAIGHGLRPILCVGEVFSEYEAGRTEQVVKDQVISSLAGVSDVGTIAIAYEPVWAIGTGKASTGEAANRTIGLIRSLISRIYSSRVANEMRILYGGSVTSGNISEFVSQSEIDGALVGGASLKAQEFVGIVQKTAEIRGA